MPMQQQAWHLDDGSRNGRTLQVRHPLILILTPVKCIAAIIAMCCALAELAGRTTQCHRLERIRHAVRSEK